LLFTHFQYKPRFKFGVEAKLLAETDTLSKNATTLIREYVENAGMGKFINKIYEEDGFMLGYILNGETKKIVVKINLKITDTYTYNERLTKHKHQYLSIYSLDGKRKELNHIFLVLPSSLN